MHRWFTGRNYNTKQVDVVLLLKTGRHAAIITMHYNLYFVINELFRNSLITLLCIAKEALLN